MKTELILDSTQINSFLECPRLHHYEHEMHLQKVSSKPRRRVMDIGSYGHKLLELFYIGIASGMSRNSALEFCFAYKAEDICECGHVSDAHKPTSTNPILYDGISCKYKKCTCLAFTEIPALVSKKDETFLRKRLLEYFATYINNDIHPYGPDTVEVGFSHKLYEDDKFLFILEGKIDVLGRYAGVDSFTDHKFQERKKDLYDKSIQFRNYALVTGYNQAFINYVRLAQEISSDTFVRRIIVFSPPEMILWEQRLINVYKKITAFREKAKGNPNFWVSEDSDPNWSRCSGKFGYVCDFTTLCEELFAPVVKNKIEYLYTIGKEWKPW